MQHIKLTMAQALVRYLGSQYVDVNGESVPYFAGTWAIFGHGNVAGMGEALFSEREHLPTYRAHNEQSMAHAAIAFSKTHRRQRAMVCTTSIGPGATNMVTAAALAHVNRLPVLFLPGDVFASREPDPVLQQIECAQDSTISANDCFRPVSNYFDRIIRPEQILDSLPKAMAMFFNPADCGPATISLCQDVQTEAYAYPVSFFEKRVWRQRRQRSDEHELSSVSGWIREAERPVIISGGGVLYSGAEKALSKFSELSGMPIVETQAGKGAVSSSFENNLGAVGVTGTSAANRAIEKADLIIGIGSRLQDFTTGSRDLLNGTTQRLVQVNVKPLDAHKQEAQSVVGDAKATIEDLTQLIKGYCVPTEWRDQCQQGKQDWLKSSALATKLTDTNLPTDAQIVGVVNKFVRDDAIVVCAAGGLPGELHKHWAVDIAGGYHVEYGYSCMGYEIAGGLGVKMAAPEREVIVMVGDGSYLMANSEIATSVMLGKKLTILVLDNRGFGCINRLQKSTGSAPFNNLLVDSEHRALPKIDFAAHAASLGAISEKVSDLHELKDALMRSKNADKTYVISIDTDPDKATEEGGHWWEVSVPEVSKSKDVQAARRDYEASVQRRREGRNHD